MINESASAMHDDCTRDDERKYVCPNGCKCDCHGSNGLGTARYRVGDIVAVAGYPIHGEVVKVDEYGDISVRFIAEIHSLGRISLVRRYVGDDEK